MHKKTIIALTAVAAMLLTANAAFAGFAVTVTSVPEPTSLSLFAAGIGMLAVTRYLRGKQ